VTAASSWPPGPFSVTVSVQASGSTTPIDWINIDQGQTNLKTCSQVGPGQSCIQTSITGGTAITVALQGHYYYKVSCRGETPWQADWGSLVAGFAWCRYDPLVANATINVYLVAGM
jgi:hypothetical protein